MLDKLKPISGKHSINRVVATVFSPQKFLKPQDIYEEVNKLDGFNKYAKKSLLKPRSVTLSNTKIEVKDEEVEGFVFEGFNEVGEIKDIFKLENKSNDNAIISFESRKYDRWKGFKADFEKDLKTLSGKVNFYVNAISLNYRDEFQWIDDKINIDVDSVFKNESDSELLNKKFLSSKNGTIVMISKGVENGNNYEDKIEISFNNDIRRIVIDHQYAIRLNEYHLFKKLFSSDKFTNYFEVAHAENKKVLRDILTDKCQLLINI
tara:strand:- start:1172 stop:1960 length:789 start_codon:yes stop_codon:yes gene_type:complete